MDALETGCIIFRVCFLFFFNGCIKTPWCPNPYLVASFCFFLQTSIITHGEIGQWGRQKLSRAMGTSSYELVCRITIPEFGHGPQFPTNTLVEPWTMLNLQASGTSSSSWSPSKISKGPSLLGIWCQRGRKTAQSIELVGPCCAMVPCKLSLQLRFWSTTKKASGTFLLQSWISLTAGILDTKAWNEQSGRHGHFYPPIIACRLSCCLWIPHVHLYRNKSAHIMHMPCKFHACRTIHPRWSRLSGEPHI